jgi:hypothetical protein
MGGRTSYQLAEDTMDQDKQIIIAVNGVKGSGKDTLGGVLCRNHRFSSYAFATPLKSMIRIAFPHFRFSDVYGPSENRETEYECYPLVNCPWCGGAILDEPGGSRRCAENPKHDKLPRHLTPRIALQTLGTDWGRHLHQNIWAEAAMGHLTSIRSGKRWVLTDCRFMNEAQTTRAAGGYVIRLKRGLEAARAAYAAGEFVHPSEADLLTAPDEFFDYVVDNTGPVSVLPVLVEEMLAALGVG